MQDKTGVGAGCAVFYGIAGEEEGKGRGQGGREGDVLTEKCVAVMGEWRKSPWVGRGQGAMVPFII